jgi:hypothetical protein
MTTKNNQMKKINLKSIILLPALFAYTFTMAQMKIKDGTIVGTSNSPNANAILELESNNKGFLPPQIALSNTSTPALGSVAGMVIYNTATAGSGSTAVTPGFYYNNGTIWIRLTDATSGGWSLTGNSGTTPGTGAGQNFMGTTDNEDVVFARNNIQAGLLDDAERSTSWGVGALLSPAGGYQNTAIGYYALGSNNTLGSGNAAVGNYALYSNTQGGENDAFGVGALGSNTIGSGNVAIGSAALGGTSDVTGTYNTGIGTGANVLIDGITNATAVGYDALANASNNMQFGNENVIGWGFGSAIPTSSKVFIVGTNSTNGNGAYLSNTGVWNNASDRNLKEDFSTPDGKDILSRIKQLSVSRWKYKGSSEYHIGPMAQDFYSEFNVGTDNTHVSTIDPAGVALVGIQELSGEVDSLQNANAQEQQTNNNLQQQLNDLKTTIGQMQTAMSQCCNSYSSNMAKEAATPVVITGTDVPTLQQNTPNPYNGSTVIGYYLPQSTTNAEIIVTDLSGNVIKSISLNGTGNGQITFSAGSLAAGSYFYTLLVNGQKIDTKQMIIAN